QQPLAQSDARLARADAADETPLVGAGALEQAAQECDASVGRAGSGDGCEALGDITDRQVAARSSGEQIAGCVAEVRVAQVGRPQRIGTGVAGAAERGTLLDPAHAELRSWVAQWTPGE